MRHRKNTGDDFYSVLAITMVSFGTVVTRWEYSVEAELRFYLTDVPPCGLIRLSGESARERFAAMERGGQPMK
jgi:hypothetical protein